MRADIVITTVVDVESRSLDLGNIDRQAGGARNFTGRIRGFFFFDEGGCTERERNRVRACVSWISFTMLAQVGIRRAGERASERAKRPWTTSDLHVLFFVYFLFFNNTQQK